MQSRDGPPGAVRLAAVLGHNQGGASRFFDDARSHNSDHAAVPSITVKDHAELAGEVRFGGKLGFNLRQDSSFFFLPLQVELVQLLGNFAASLLVFAGKEFDHVLGYVHTSGGVDTRAPTEAHVASPQPAPNV